MSARTLPVKTLLNPDEYLRFSNTCRVLDIPQSRVLRDCAARFVREHEGQHRPVTQSMSRTEPVPNMPIFRIKRKRPMRQ